MPHAPIEASLGESPPLAGNGSTPAALVYVVVLNWNGRSDTLACLESLERLDHPNRRVIVVDNGSSDDSVAAIRTAFPGVEVIETGANLGFSGGNNIGIRLALERGADYVLLLNNDTVVDPGLVTAFLAASERRPDAGAFGAKIFFYDDPRRVWFAGARWEPTRAHFIQIGEGVLDGEQSFSTSGETAYACGCAFFVSAQRLRDVGLLDEDFFLYFEETDWCYRARRLGYPSIFVPEARLWHKVSVSFGGERSPLALYFLTRNRLLWAQRHGKLTLRMKLYGMTACALASRFIGPFVRSRDASMRQRWWSLRTAFRDPRNRAYYLGVRDFFLRRLGDCPTAVRQLSTSWSAATRIANHAARTA